MDTVNRTLLSPPDTTASTGLVTIIERFQNSVEKYLHSKDLRTFRRWYMREMRKKSWEEINQLGHNPALLLEALEGFQVAYHIKHDRKRLFEILGPERRGGTRELLQGDISTVSHATQREGIEDIQKPPVALLDEAITGRDLTGRTLLESTGDTGTHDLTRPVEAGYLSMEEIRQSIELREFLESSIGEKEGSLRSRLPWQFLVDTFITAWNLSHPDKKLYRYNKTKTKKFGEDWKKYYQVFTLTDFNTLFRLSLKSVYGSKVQTNVATDKQAQGQTSPVNKPDRVTPGCDNPISDSNLIYESGINEESSINPFIPLDPSEIQNILARGRGKKQNLLGMDSDRNETSDDGSDASGSSPVSKPTPPRKGHSASPVGVVGATIELSREEKITMVRDARAVYDSVFRGALMAYKKDKTVEWHPEDFGGIPSVQEGVMTEFRGRDLHIRMSSVFLDASQAVFWRTFTINGIRDYITRKSPKNIHHITYDDGECTYTIHLSDRKVVLHLPEVQKEGSSHKKTSNDGGIDELERYKSDFTDILRKYLGWYISRFPDISRKEDFTFDHLPSFTWKLQYQGSMKEFDIYYRNMPPNSDAQKVHTALQKTPEIAIFSGDMAQNMKSSQEEGKSTHVIEYTLPGRVYRLHLRMVSQ